MITDDMTVTMTFCTLNFQLPLKGTTAAADKRFAKVNNLNAGQIQLANESYTLKSGFTAKEYSKS